ncbi:MAG: zinc-dependent peptidase [Agarilytica sp.]
MFTRVFGGSKNPGPEYTDVWRSEWSTFLERSVNFYQNLNSSDRELFERRILLFLHSTDIEGGVAVEVTDEDRLLVAASAIIPVWTFPKWHYFNLKAVYLLPAAFDENFVCSGEARITGMVGTGPMHGKMALSKPHLHQGFLNSRDKRNVGIHEFVHLIDMADGECDGFPERLKEYAYAIPWFEFARQKMNEIIDNDSNIRDYGATNTAEFFSVASEYFFERPQMLKKKHPKLCSALEQFYQQNVEEITNDRRFSKSGPCPCGSGKKYKRCCLVES